MGLSKTYCANKLITDSGAGGTAIATGQKTNYHSVGVDVEGRPLKSLVDFAVGKGKSAQLLVAFGMPLQLIFVAITKIVMLRLKLWRIM